MNKFRKDFKQWWNEAEIIAGEGSMDAAEEAWDAQQHTVEYWKNKYEELLMAVQRKFPDESRHETALRYINQAENQENIPSCSPNVV